MKIIPAVLPKRYSDIERAAEHSFGAANTMQIDFVDGHFAPNRTWWFNGKDPEIFGEFEREERGLPHWQEMNYEFDLMLKDPLPLLDQLFMLGPSKIILHVESLNAQQTIQYLESLPEIIRTTIAFGIAIGLDTDPAVIAPYVPYITGIQCMGIARPGFQGQVFDQRVIEHIKRIKELYPTLPISVDGAVNEETIDDLIDAGATEFVIGSAIFGSEQPRGTIKMFQRLCRDAEATASENSN